MNKMTEDNCRIGYTKSQAWILKVLRFFALRNIVALEVLSNPSYNLDHVLPIEEFPSNKMFAMSLTSPATVRFPPFEIEFLYNSQPYLGKGAKGKK